MHVKLFIHFVERPWEKDRQADSAQWRIAPFRLRYQGDDKAQWSRHASQGRARVWIIITLLLVIRRSTCTCLRCLEKMTDMKTVLTGVFPKVVIKAWFPKVVIESVLSLDYYLSYDYCLHPFPPSKQANPPQIEANNTETNKLYCLSDTLTQTQEKVPKTVRSSLIQLLKVLALSSAGDQRQRLQR